MVSSAFFSSAEDEEAEEEGVPNFLMDLATLFRPTPLRTWMQLLFCLAMNQLVAPVLRGLTSFWLLPICDSQAWRSNPSWLVCSASDSTAVSVVFAFPLVGEAVAPPPFMREMSDSARDLISLWFPHRLSLSEELMEQDLSRSSPRLASDWFS